MIDIHCHILPGLDDGPDTMEESLAMAEMALQDGIRITVATPHMLNGLYENDLESVQEDVLNLQEALKRRGLPLEIRVGGDVHVLPGMVEAVRAGRAVTIDNMGKYLLVELPSNSIPEGVKEEIFQLKLHGITPIITHPERNALILRDPLILEEFVEMGSLAQLTAMSLTGGFGRVARQGAETLLKRGLAHVISSDAHSVYDRPPLLSKAVEAAAAILGSFDEAEQMVKHTPAAVLEGEDFAWSIV